MASTRPGIARDLAGREVLPALSTVDLRTHLAGAPLKKLFNKGFV